MSASTDDIIKIERYAEQLGDVNARIQEKATTNLANSKNSMVLPLVTSLLKDDNPNRRKNAAKLLSTIGNRGSVRPLIEALSDEKSEVRFCACGALGMLGDIDAIPKLTELARSDESKRVRKQAKKAVEDIRMSQTSKSIKRQIDDEVFKQKADEIMERMKKMKAGWKKDKPHKSSTNKPRGKIKQKR